MHPDLTKFVDKDAPDLNRDLYRGLAEIHLRHSGQYIERVLRSAAIGFPKEVTFVGMRALSPLEDYHMSVRPRGKRRSLPSSKGAQKQSSQRQYETSQTDFYLAGITFAYNGENFPEKTIYLPYPDTSGSLAISDTRWQISPVLADRVISIGVSQIFVRLLRDRLTFSREPYHCKKNGVRENSDVVFSRIYHKSKEADGRSTKTAKTSMVHYLFCKFGFAGAMKKYAGATPVVAQNFDPAEFPADEWNIYSSTGIPPKTTGNRRRVVEWNAPTLKVAVRKSEENETVRAMVTGFFYVDEHFPMLVTEKHANLPEGWIAPMGYMLLSENQNRGRIEESIHKHLASLDDYADPIVIDNMRAIGIHITDIYDFFAIIAKDFGTWISNNQDKVNSMYDKELNVLYFVLFDITKAIFNLFFALKANTRKPLSRNDVEKAINDNLRQGLIYAITKTHGEASSISYSGDSMAFKATATLTPQTNTVKTARKGGDRNTNDPTRKLHPSVAEVGAITAMSKSDPSGRSKINHYMQLSPGKDLIQRNPKFMELLDMIGSGELSTRAVVGGFEENEDPDILRENDDSPGDDSD